MSIKDQIMENLEVKGVVVLPPMDVFESIALVKSTGISINCTMLDPWYNKGIGGEHPLEEYDSFISKLLNRSAEISNLIYLWGFPEIVGPYVRYSPPGFYMATWITWYYKNCLP